MSLRDQLVAKGLVSKKQARRADQEAKKARRDRQGAREKKRVARARALAAAEAAEAERLERAREAADARRAHQAEAERIHRIRMLIHGNRIRPGRGHRFHHRSLDGKRLHRLEVSPALAEKLRGGEAAIAALRNISGVVYEPITARAAAELEALAPQLLVHWARGAEDVGAPDLAWVDRDWPVSLRARRATAADLERFGAAPALTADPGAGPQTGA